MTTRIVPLVALVFAAAALVACDESGPTPATPNAPADSPADPALAEAPAESSSAGPVRDSAALEPVEVPARLPIDVPSDEGHGASKGPVVGSVPGAQLPDDAFITPGSTERVRAFVRFMPGVDRDPALALVRSVGATVAYRYRLLPDLVALHELPIASLPALRGAPGVAAVLPDQVRHANLTESRALMHASPAELSAYSNGSGVTVCVLDTGLNKAHPAFAGAVVAEKDFVNNDNNATDDEGHGTNVGGIIASRDAVYGGVAPGAGLAVAKVLAADGSGYDDDIIAALDWCTHDVGGDVVNLSLGGGKYFGTCDFDALSAAVNASVDAGVVNVIAAGNEGYTNAVGAPGCASRAITVGAVYDASFGSVSWCMNGSCSVTCTDQSTPDLLTCFSNKAMKVDVTAPGSEITAPDGLSNGYSAESGTSQATPHVAGLVARLLGQRPELGPNDVRAFLWRDAVDRGAAGFDVSYGHGRVDARATLADPRAVTCTSSSACGDGDACTTDSCALGFCAHRFACEDDNASTTDTCNAGVCGHTPVVVNDGRSCTTDTLDACLGPRYSATAASCNPTCALAIPLTLGTTVSGTTVSGSKNLNSSCPGYAMPGADVVYRIYLRPEQAVTFTLTTSANWDPAIYLLTGTSATACDVARCVGGMDVGVARQGETMARVRVPVAGYYFMVVDTYASNGTGTFSLSAAASCDPDDAGRACDDGNACTANDTCIGGVCVAGAPSGCLGDGECDDGDACNGAETCAAGACVGGVAPSCGDGDACTTDACLAASGCVHTPAANGTSCSNSNPCDGAETCLSGICQNGSPLVCADASPCTNDACVAGVGCQFVAVANGTSCADADACNGAEECVAGACVAGTPMMCSDADPCTIDSCSAGACASTPAPEGSACGDGNVCNGAETCASGACVGGAALACDDQNPCTVDGCDALAGCTHIAVGNGTSCADNNLCNGAEQCQAGVCASGAPLQCNDANPCTFDSCDAATGCASVPLVDGSGCGDGNVCNGLELCQAGACQAGAALDCNDANVCTNDACNPASGCDHAAASNGTSCSDGNACNGVETCAAGQCGSGAAPNCDDGNACTADACVPASGCAHTTAPLDGSSCSDGDSCTSGETCQAGTCGGGSSTCAHPKLVFGAAAASVTLPGSVTIADEDLASYDPTTALYALHFDGSDVGLGSAVIDALAIDMQGRIILSFASSVTISGLVGGPSGNTVDPRDLVRFTPSSLGATTAGTFTFLFDGSDVGLTTSAENVNALAILPDGSYLISTTGSPSVPGVSATNADILRFVPSALGSVTAGTWTLYFDGSDVGLTKSGENIDGLAVMPDGTLLISTSGAASVAGLNAANEDVMAFMPTSLGSTTAGSFGLYFDGSTRGFNDDVANLEYLTSP